MKKRCYIYTERNVVLFFSRQVVSDSSRPHHARSLFLTISWSLPKFMSIEPVMPSNQLILCYPLPLCLQSFPALGSFPVSQLLAAGGQSIGASASALPKSIQRWFPLRLAGLISLLSKGLWRVCSSTTIWKHGIPLKYKKEWNFATYSDMDKLGEHYAKWNESGGKDKILYDITYMWNLNKYNKPVNITKNIKFTGTENKLVVTSGQMGKGDYRGRGSKRCKLLCVLHNTVNITYIL